MDRLAGAHGMTDEIWARHANPLSGWSRMPVLPLLALAVWARVWIGWWCLLPVAVLIVWTWANPRVFPPPARHDAWMSRAVLGERVWLNAAAVPIPGHHARMARLLALAALPGVAALAWGLWRLDPWAVVAGLAVAMGAKLWFLDRMVWLWADMQAHPAYADWTAGRSPP